MKPQSHSTRVMVVTSNADVPPNGADAPKCGRFSTGIEWMPEAPADNSVGRFSTGHEAMPDAPADNDVGRFSTGIEQAPGARANRRFGSFADGYPHVVKR